MKPASEWAAMTRLADPLADRTVARIAGDWPDSAEGRAVAMGRLALATRLMSGWTSNASLVDWTPPPVPRRPDDPDAEAQEAVRAGIVAALRDYLAQGRTLPAWTRPADVALAESTFMDYGPLSCTLLFCTSLPECYVLPHLAEVLHVAGQLEAHTEHRIRATAAMVFPVMMQGGLTDPQGGGVAQVLKVRLIHATIRHLILHGPPQEAEGRVQGTGEASARANLHEALLAHGWDVERKGLPCNQLELAYTLLTFGFVFLKGMRSLRMELGPQREQAFLHAWNVAGHVLGIRDDLMVEEMAQAEAMFASIQGFAAAQPAEPDARPGLGRALMAAMARTIRVPVLRNVPVPMTQWLIGPRTARAIGVAGIDPLARMVFTVVRVATQAFDALVRLAVPGFSLTRMFTRVVGYHLLTRFLMDQTRPLALPEQLLGQMQRTVAAWHHDPSAPRWVNRAEDRLTTEGEWHPEPAAATSPR